MDDKEVRKTARAIKSLVDKCQPLLAGHGSLVQGAALADLTARWVAGHFDKRGPAATKRLRAELLETQMRTIEELVPDNEKLILEHKGDEAPSWARK